MKKSTLDQLRDLDEELKAAKTYNLDNESYEHMKKAWKILYELMYELEQIPF